MDLAPLGDIQELAPQEEGQADFRVGSSLGPYRIHECIGDGGMGRVYRAEHVHLGRPVAIKFLLERFAADAEAVSRFLEEAKTVNRVRHPNLIDIYDYFVEHDQLLVAYVMELLRGRSLRDALVHDTLGLARIYPIARQIASALHAVHAVGIVHRDLKPENVYLCEGDDEEDIVKILDFGVAKFTRGEVTHRTQQGMAMGSPWYMAPEQARGAWVDQRADVYSFGVILYELLTGRVPFPGESYADVLSGHLSKAPPPLRRRDGWTPPEALSRVVLRCLEKDVDARPHDMESAWQELLDAGGPQYASAWTTPAALRANKVPRPSRVTLPLTGSDPPIRLTPIEGAPEMFAETGPSDELLPAVACPSPADLPIRITPSAEGPPDPIPSEVLQPVPRSGRRMPLWVWATLALAFATTLLSLVADRRSAASATMEGAVADESPTSALVGESADQEAATPPPSAEDLAAPQAPAAPQESTPEAPTLEATASSPSDPPRSATEKTEAKAAPSKAPTRPRIRDAQRSVGGDAPRAARPKPRGKETPQDSPPRESRDAIIDPFR